MHEDYQKGKSVGCSEILNFNPRLTAFEDFMLRTMDVLQGVWSKLNYIRELRAPDGSYEHWGLARIHGEETTHAMIADVHSELYLQLLRTPLPELLEQLHLSADDADCSAAQLARQLRESTGKITPQDLRGGAPEHLKAVLLIADLLSKHSQARSVVQSQSRSRGGGGIRP